MKLEHRYNLKWNFLLHLAMVHCFCMCIVYVKLELNKPIHDLIYLPNGLNIYSLCLKCLSFQFSLADGLSFSLKQSHCIPACQHFLLFKFHPQSTHSHALLPQPMFHSINVTSLPFRSFQQNWVPSYQLFLPSVLLRTIVSRNLLLFLKSDFIPETYRIFVN